MQCTTVDKCQVWNCNVPDKPESYSTTGILLACDNNLVLTITYYGYICEVFTKVNVFLSGSWEPLTRISIESSTFCKASNEGQYILEPSLWQLWLLLAPSALTWTVAILHIPQEVMAAIITTAMRLNFMVILISCWISYVIFRSSKWANSSLSDRLCCHPTYNYSYIITVKVKLYLFW